MLNISHNTITNDIDCEQYSSLNLVEGRSSSQTLIRTLIVIFFVLFLSLFLPWTQNINTNGTLTTLKPNQRPQTAQSVIAGQIEYWYVQEGDFVNAGDTILHISEVKAEYFDPDLVGRTEQQLVAKRNTTLSYDGKVKALEDQIGALRENRVLKLEQVENKIIQSQLKVVTDSMEVEAARLNYQIADEQFKRMDELIEYGLYSRTDYEKRELALQKAQADQIAKENKLLTSRNELINAEIELNSTEADFRDKIAKAQSDKFTALSNLYNAEASVAKLENEFANYSLRNEFYYILAPQSGYVTEAIQSGIGETIKEGEEVVSIMPAEYELAVEMYVRPIDLPLLKKGQEVRIQFDGWPAIVFSGWPNNSFGTYGGKVFAIDNFISPNGMYRVLVSSDPNDRPWPDALRFGSGAFSMVLLNDVPIWYELWRQINGFPPDYYAFNGEGYLADSK
ncbi:MAG: HlyD family efflux transporter periplasmic adaptor subunit [Bacteroidota bacterium]